MLQESINQLSIFMDSFPAIFKVEVISENDVVINYNIEATEETKKERFESAQEMLEWCEENL